MASRMEKYYQRQIETKKRSEKNKDLYKEMYDLGQYSNIEAVTTLNRTNEIDIKEVKKILRNREDYKRQKEYRELLRGKEEILEPKKELKIEEVKNYDIKDELEKIKEYKNEDDMYRRLNNTNYDILKELKIKNDFKKEALKTEEEMQEIMNKSTSTALLNKLDNEQLSLDMLDELASSGNTIVGTKDSIEHILKEAKEDAEKDRTTQTLDNSFYTTSINFDKSDFEGEVVKKSNKVIKITVGVIVTVILLIIGILIYKFMK